MNFQLFTKVTEPVEVHFQLIYKEQAASKKEVKQVLPEQVKFKYKYNGKELLDELGLNVYDYGARTYDPAVPRFWQVDPLAEKYGFQSVYVYADDNPLFFVDINGMGVETADYIDIKKNNDGTYTVVDGEANSDKNFYVVDENGKRTGQILGKMLTEYSFHREDGSAIIGAIIDLNDQSGQKFFNNEIVSIGLFEYIDNAKGREPLDFKSRGVNERNEGISIEQYHYRGMPFNEEIASARDIGNYSAGYVARKNGFNWSLTRFAFDALETQQYEGTLSTVLFYPFNRIREGQPTQQAQKEGYNIGYQKFKQNHLEKLFDRAITPIPIGPKY